MTKIVDKTTHPRLTTLSAWLNYIETLHNKESDYTLDRITTVANRCKLQQFSCPVITVAGTNGKGSCVALLEAILINAGYRTGAYTSPYLLTYNERIRFNGKHATDTAIIDAFAYIDKARQQTPLTYFEFSVLTALQLFQQANLDVVLLEVGLGGRLDAVNIVDPDLAIISTIALDHTELLGNDREQIAKEKSGIMRANKPVVCGDPDPPQTLIQAAQKLAAPLYCQQKNFSYHSTQSTWTFSCDNTPINHLPMPQLALQNAATVLMALQCLTTTLPVKLAAIKAGLTSAALPGRVQIIPGKVTHVLDVAHNPQSTQHLAVTLNQLKNKTEQPSTISRRVQFSNRLKDDYTMCALRLVSLIKMSYRYLKTIVRLKGEDFIPSRRDRKIIAIFSMLADKDIAGSIAPLANCIDTWLIAPLTNKRAASPDLLITALKTHQIKQYQIYPTLQLAYQQAQIKAKSGDIIVVFGSFYTVYLIMELIKPKIGN